uniref:Uncharacterized protein n=1 Tax=Ascaris lumbricoides TaxID=6252 RepID=A0A0M3HT83_ASCLU
MERRCCRLNETTDIEEDHNQHCDEEASLADFLCEVILKYDLQNTCSGIAMVTEWVLLSVWLSTCWDRNSTLRKIG